MAEVEHIMPDVEIEELGNSMKSELISCISSHIDYDSGSEFCLIPRIHPHIRMIDRNSYDPIMLSIGPYNNGSSALSSMESEKWNRLDYILKLNCEKGLKDYLTIINRLEKRARMCYSGDIKMNKRKFLQTLLLDGCFVLVSLGGLNEFISAGPQRATASSSHAEIVEEEMTSGQPNLTERIDIQQINTRNQNDIINTVVEENTVPEIELCLEISDHQTEQCVYQDNTRQIGQWYDIFVIHDLLLLENQIPFFIVEAIYEVVSSNKMTPTCKSGVARFI
uniref:Uncharacterized protein n=1 Tax=Triticum urartu TaxID=4572 RepID=A0A8R7JX33_TRIUA